MTYDFSCFDTLALTETEKEILKDLRRMADESGAEYGCALFSDWTSEMFTSGEENRVVVPASVLGKKVALYHSHTNDTLLSLSDFRLLLNENVVKICVISTSSFVQVTSSGGIIPTQKEFEKAAMEINQEINEVLFDRPDFWDMTVEERKMVAFAEQSYRIPRYFNWKTEGGKII